MTMIDDTRNKPRPSETQYGDGETLSGRQILAILAILALVCVGGYFFILKMIAVSQQDDCVLAQRRNCATGL
jgi:hypothetical protein